MKKAMKKLINKTVRFIFFRIIVRFIVVIGLGLNVRHRKHLPKDGPAILVANHNSHLDTLVLMTLLDPKLLDKVQPVAAMDYFMKNKVLAWFATQIIGIIPLKRQFSAHDNPLQPINEALDAGKILILFPEGSRGEPEQMSSFKKGIARLAEAHPKVPVVPVYLHGLGKALPKGEALLVPFFCDVFVGPALYFKEDRSAYMQKLQGQMHELEQEYRAGHPAERQDA